MPEAAALLALWNGVDPAHAAEYERWHAEEHVPERLTVPGMQWARRYAALWPQPGPRYLTLYGLRDARVLEEDAYQRLLREPTPWSARMRPFLCDISRWVCRLAAPHAGPQGGWLQLHTASAAEPACQHADLLAERLPDAAPLPWLQDSQALVVEGRWLLARGLAQPPACPVPDTLAYAALPVGVP
ncbi:hypothetical protein GCM10007320_52040 [Pseudorhodoferax aquiterrae]|uniref:Uncharacterized protein n=1 Tax=Pseudorhodoferax aquiterrae TaxID=747304 RepID=A0ABQ3GA39_9BURK|nr:DUF4286 family protein [Pseudorhodoferax aquiterrae]GHC97366.1 hypothetical protein GCM10007320_52040 [Pseudorhodoferax aquiterrae]